jgi:hypothetical protein
MKMREPFGIALIALLVIALFAIELTERKQKKTIPTVVEKSASQ